MDTLRRAISPDVRVVDDGAPTATGVTPVTGATEHDEQCALFAWAAANEAQHPELAMLVAIPNGGYRPMATAARLKAEGVKAGYPDCFLAVRRGEFGGLFLELKRADHSNHATAAQRQWIDALRYYGYSAVIVYGAQEAISTIMAYLAQE